MIRHITKELSRYIFSSRDAEASSVAAKLLSTTYDACVVGSGPGGSVAAATLVEAGLKVLLIERGPFIPAEQFNFRVLGMSNRFGHAELTSGYRTVLYQGNALGGSSLIYGAVAMKPQQFIFDEWQALSGVASMSADSLEPHYNHVAETMSVTRQSQELENRPNAIVREMATALGRPEGLVTVNRYTQGCAGVGLCHIGCGMNLKGNMINSFLPVALATGNLTVLTECEALEVVGENSPAGFRAVGLKVSLRDHHTGRTIREAMIKARTFVVAAGAFFSSAMLLRSHRFPHRERIGSKVYLQPHAQIFALFDRAITERGQIRDGQYVPHHGVPAIYNFTGYLEEHNFWWLASILYPGNLASFTSNLSPDEHFEVMRRFHYTTSITITLKDEPAKSRVKLKDGRARLEFRESQRDLDNLRCCFLLAAKAYLAVGARRVFLPMLRPPRIEKESDLRKIESMKFGYDDLMLYSDHTSGGNQFGADARRGVTDAAGRVFETENVYVADSSLFPSAPGVNPSWTIMALARLVALRIANERVYQ